MRAGFVSAPTKRFAARDIIVNVHKKTFQYGPHSVTIETGRLARQADGAVLVSMGDTVVLVRARSGIPAALGVSVAFALDLLAHYDVFVNPTSSTAALALLVVPLWSALLFAPVVMLIAWLAVRRRSHMGNGAA